MFNKKGQLGYIEGKFFIVGFLIGLVGGLALVFLGTKKIIPFKIPLVCGTVLPFGSKKGQLGAIEAKFFFFGFFLGIVAGLVLVFLGAKGILPFKIPLVCG